MKTISRILALGAALAAPLAHAAVTLTASPDRVAAGEPVTVTVEFSGTGGRSAPDVPGREALGAADFTETGLRAEFDGSGAKTVWQRFSWRVTAAKPGTYALGPVAVGGETSSGVTVTVEPARKRVLPLPGPSTPPGDERVPAEGLELAPAEAPQPTGVMAKWADSARKNPLPWVAGICGLALAWLAVRTYSFLKKIEELAGPETHMAQTHDDTPSAAARTTEAADGAPFADQAVALVRQRIAQAVGRDLSHLATSELAALEPSDAKRALVAEALRLADAVRFGKQVGIEDEVRRLLKEYLA